MAILGAVTVAALGAAAMELRSLGRARAAVEAAQLAELTMAELRLLRADELERLLAQPAEGGYPPPFDAVRWSARAVAASSQRGTFELEVAAVSPRGGVVLRSLADPAEQR